jgi:hypothetical protein
VTNYGWKVEKAVEEAMDVFGYKDRSTIYDAMSRVKNALGDRPYDLEPTK